MLADFTNSAQAPHNYIISVTGPSHPFLSATAIRQIWPDKYSSSLDVRDTDVEISDGFNILQNSGTGENKLQSATGIGPGGGLAPITIAAISSTRHGKTNPPYRKGLARALPGRLNRSQPTTIGAPTITNFASRGSTTWSYECTGTDVDGNTYPGTVASITDGPATITCGEIIVQCPFSAGAASETIWRTAGGPNQGSLVTGAQPARLLDTGGTATSGSPTATNNSIPKICTAGEQFCELSGTTSTPTVACTAGTKGWVFHNVSATTSPFAYVCNGSAWGAAY